MIILGTLPGGSQRGGVAALAPDLLSRVGGRRGFEDPEKATEAIRNMTKDEVCEDLITSMDYLKGHPRVTEKIGVVGFCWGGSQSLYFQTRCKGLSAGVVFYGSSPDDLDSVQNIDWPYLGIYADRELDARITGKVPDLEAALKKHGKKYSIHIYPGARHAFHTNTNPQAYHPEAARDAWTKTIAFFKETLD